MACYSWRGEGSWEELRVHVERALEALGYFFTRRYHVLVGQRLGVDGEGGAELLRLVVLLHDLGKAADRYQARCGAETCSFRGHEYVSAYAAYPLLENTFGEEVARVAAAAIMLHHHTMQDRLEGVPGRWKLSRGCVDSLMSLIQVGVDYLGIRLEGSKSGVKEFVGTLTGSVRSLFPRVAVLLYPLMIVDHVAASRRGSESTVLGSEAGRVYREWQWRFGLCLAGSDG